MYRDSSQNPLLQKCTFILCSIPCGREESCIHGMNSVIESHLGAFGQKGMLPVIWPYHSLNCVHAMKVYGKGFVLFMNLRS